MQEVINFTRGVPANESFPVMEISEAAITALTNRGHGPSTALSYGPAQGYAPLLDLLAQWYNVSNKQVLASHGSLQILDFVCGTLFASGSTVVCESPTYDRTLTLFRKHQFNIIGMAMANDGPTIEALKDNFRHPLPKLFYVIPDFQNPSGITWSLAKRHQLIETARKIGAIILEDAPYKLLRYRGEEQPSLFSLAPDIVLHMSSFTKLISPGVRVGFLVGNQESVSRITKTAENVYISPCTFSQAAVFHWCKDGKLAPQLGRLRKLYGPRLNTCVTIVQELLPNTIIAEPDGGFFLSLQLSEGVLSQDVLSMAPGHGLNLTDGRGFFPIPSQGESFIRLPFCALQPAEIVEGVSRLATIINKLRINKLRQK